MQPPVVGSEAYGALLTLSALVFQPLQFAIPTYLLACGRPRKDGHLRRCAIAYAGIAAFNIAISMAVWWAMSLSPTSPVRYATNAIAYSLYLVALVLAVRHCFEMNLWNALFCATAGYTIQNLGSGSGELVRLLLAVPVNTVAATLCADLSTISVIVLYHFVFIRHARRIGKLGDDARSMLGMLVLVIMVVIFFDVIIRGLERGGAQLGFLVALRFVHIAVCMFMLYAEGENLVNARLRAEVSTRDLLAGERERQYEVSRETIEAVNRRVHDIRHTVLRELSDSEAQVSREVLAEVARDIAVYDAPVRTGSEVLDTILTEKSLVCRRRGVTLSCIADGTAVAGLPAADLYALFGALLDGAMDAVCELPDTRQRSVSLTLRRVGDLALVHLEHYAGEDAGADEGTLREIVERHGGTLTASRRENVATVDVMLPVG